MATVEERLAALETQLAQLTATTPTSYYTHQYSGEEIDAAVGQAQNALRTDTAQSLTPTQQAQGQKNLGVTWPCNPNLLDNWYFGNPVNQRGQTEYTGAGYTIDRWRIDIGSSVNVSNGITLNNAGTYWGQYFDESLNAFKGMTLTGSILLSNGHLQTGTLTHNGVINQGETFFSSQDDGLGMYVQALSGTLTQVEINTLKDNVTLLAAKLELGDTQTLAHQDAEGKWALNEIPDYGEQLRRCQRYYQVHNAIYWIPQNADGVNRLSITIPPMRTVPAVTFSEALNNTGNVSLDTALCTDDTIQFYAQNVTGLCGVRSITASADL